MTTLTPRQLLSQAADHIERFGKIEGKWAPDEVINVQTMGVTTTECPVCVGGALAMLVNPEHVVMPNFIHRPSERRVLDQALALLVKRLDLKRSYEYTTPLDAVIEWSDASTTKTVVAGLREAAG